MRLREVRELVGLRPVELDSTERVLSRCHSVEDFRESARRRLPRAVFDYVEGGADAELTVAANRSALLAWRFLPQALADVSAPDLSVELFGRKVPAPLGLAPTGYTRMVHPSGEPAVAAASAASGLPYGLSTVGSTSIERLAASGHDHLWFQLYVLRDRGLTRSLVERAAHARYEALEVSVDTAVAGRRTRDVRNGLTIPPRLSARTALEIATHVGYWAAMLRSPALAFANLADGPAVHRRPGPGDAPDRDAGDAAGRRTERALGAIEDITSMFDPTCTWEDLEQVRGWWDGPLLVKGPVGPDDARRAVELGVDGIHLSNHGGRQLDRTVATIDLVRPVREAVGARTAIVLDSGVRHGADVAVAVARGADLCMVGRPYLYGLAAAGERGVRRVLELLYEELRRTVQLLGVASVAELREHGDRLVVREHRP